MCIYFLLRCLISEKFWVIKSREVEKEDNLNGICKDFHPKAFRVTNGIQNALVLPRAFI